MSDYKPGTVAMVTMRRPESWGGDGIRDGSTYLAFYEGYEGRWITAEEGALSREDDSWKYEVRPLVVLDLAESDLQTLPRLLRRDAQADFDEEAKTDPHVHGRGLHVSEVRRRAADQIEAQTKPPRIPEPGQFGVVEAAAKRSPGRHKWVRQGDLWWNGSAWNVWGALEDPTLIREGLS